MKQFFRFCAARMRPCAIFGRPSAQRGGVAPFMILTLIGGLVTIAYVADAVRMTSDASQLKRATDAAALATAREYAAQGGDLSLVDATLAEKYVRANLGMDRQLEENLETVTVLEGRSAEGNPTIRVDAVFTAASELGGYKPETIAIYSTAEVRVASTEVALAIPNTSSENAPNLAALRRIGKEFAENLLDGGSESWLALVPYSQAVSVYDSDHPNRIRSWAAPGALNPVELTSLFRSGKASSLADRRIPDRKANLLCMYRGLNQGDNYFWDEAPSGQFQIYYRHDLPANGSPGADPISWVGPNPDFGQANGVNDTRYMVADRGCPKAALLPLSNDLQEIGERLDEMDTRFNVNYAIPMGWAAMALAPAFQGDEGWGLDDELPKQFDDGNSGRVKAVILLVNSTGMRWFDTDAYNSYVGQKIDGDSDSGGGEDSVVTRRFADLCSSFRERRIRFFLVVTGNDEATDEDGQVASASAFRRIAGAGLQTCAQKDGDLAYFSGTDFVASESLIKNRMEEIIQELRQAGGFVRLIE